MNRNRYVIVFDFETDGKSPADCNIVQIAAVPIDLRNLTILSDDFLEMDVKPNELDELGRAGYIEHREDTINWHASIQNKSVNEIVDRWEKGFAEKDAWDEFGRYIKNFNKGGSWDKQAIPAGQNIRGYDLPICERYAKKYKSLPFSKRDVFDLMDFTRIWFLFCPDPPASLSMDNLREYFGIDKTGAHDARKDVLDTSHLIVKFLGLHERIAPKITWNTEATQKV